MMKMRRGLRSRKVRTGVKRRARVNRRVATVGVVKRLLKRNAETKYASSYVEANVLHNSAIGSGDITRLVPSIVQGTNDNQRVGDSIKPLSLTVKGIVSMNSNYCDTNQVLLVRVLMLSAKNAKSWSLISATSASIASGLLAPNFEGGPLTQAFTGNTIELYQPVDTDMYNVHYDKVFRIAPSSASLEDAGKEENPASFFRIWKKIKCPATLKYDDGQAQPNNFAPFFCLGYAYADGQGADVVNTKIISNVISTLTYKDA